MEVPKPVLVAVGGLVGAIVRWCVFAAFDSTAALLLVNTVGCFLLGAIGMIVWTLRDQGELLLGLGFCGALTTFSTLSVDVAQRLDGGHWNSGSGLLVGSVVLGVGAAVAGISVAGRWSTNGGKR